MVERRNEGYFIEMTHVGNAVRVCAVDPVTGVEVTCIGAPSATKKQLSDLAVRKLEYVLAKKRSGE